MFLCAQARPHWDVWKHEMWDGKLGMWPVGHWAPAERQSANREAGAPVWKEETINQTKYWELLLKKVLVPAIGEKKWPRREWEDARFIIRIQQDRAAAHIHPIMNEAFWQGMEDLGYQNKILLYTQPANFPNTTINDLGFFRALQSMYHKSCPNDEEAQIIEYVQRAYNEYDLNKINCIWLTLMGCYNMIIECNGGNKYKIPHMGKQALEQNGALPPTLFTVTEAALEYL